MFRSQCRAGTRLGKLACSILSSGRLVPDEIVNDMLAGELRAPAYAEGFVLDGYPRTVAQARFLTGLLAARSLPQPVVVHLDVPAEGLIARLCARRQCPACGHIYNLHSEPTRVAGVCDADGRALIRRADDREDVIRERLRVYEELTGPVIQYYAGSGCHRFDGALGAGQVAAQIGEVLEACAT